MTLKELTSIDQMLNQINIINHLYPNMDQDKYKDYLEQMIPHNYRQLIVLDGDIV
jgi:hypothetical protein